MSSLTDKKELAVPVSILVIAVVTATVHWFVSVNHLLGGNGVNEIQIERGMNGREIAELLYEKGIVRCTLCFRVVSRLYGFSGDFKAGNHPLTREMSLIELARTLTQNPSFPPDIRVTVYEGLTVREIGSVLASQAGIDSASFVERAMDKCIAQKLGVDNATLEGYLYPDTYFVRPDTEPVTMIKRMVERFKEVFSDSLIERSNEIGMTVNEVVTLASIIEAETSLSDERPIISSVFHRRLELNRPLEANPTVQYVIGSKRRLLYEDLEIKSPYNTYLHPGLPPGPISNPGRESLLAALCPADTDYLYFVSDGKGGHEFSKTISEHIKAVNRYRKSRKRFHAQ